MPKMSSLLHTHIDINWLQNGGEDVVCASHTTNIQAGSIAVLQSVFGRRVPGRWEEKECERGKESDVR